MAILYKRLPKGLFNGIQLNQRQKIDGCFNLLPGDDSFVVHKQFVTQLGPTKNIHTHPAIKEFKLRTKYKERS